MIKPAEILGMDNSAPQIRNLLRQQAAIAGFGSFALRQSNLLTVLNEAARVCAAGLNVPFSKICRYRKAENDLLIEAGYGWRAGVIGHIVSRADESSPQGRAFITGQPSICNDLRQDNNFELPAFYPAHGIVSTIDVIIKGDGQPYGVLEIDNDKQHDYDQHDIDFLTAFANVLAEAVATSARTALLQTNVEQMKALVDEKDRLLEQKKRLVDDLAMLAQTAQAESQERRKAVDVAQDSVELLKAILNVAPFPVSVIAPDSTTLMWNRAAEEVFGYSASEIISQPVSKRIGAEQAIEASKLFSQALSGRNLHNVPVQRQHRKGHWLDILLSSAPVRDVHGKICAVVYSFEDVTERNIIEAKLQQSHKVQAIGQLTGGIAHDFNNLLTVIAGNLALIQGATQGNPDIKPMIDDALGASTRGANLTHQLLAYSRQQVLSPSTVNVAKLTTAIAKLLRRTLEESIDIELTVQPALWLTRVDANQLENALLNLALNARDAMPNGGTLTIDLSNVVLDEAYAEQQEELIAGDYVAISIADTGTGMSKETADRALEPFFTTKAVGAGSGLGLSMVLGFVKQSGGHLNIYSEQAYGTSVKLFLPRAPLELREMSAPPDAPSVMRHSTGEIVLLVEDDPTVRRLAVRFLTNLGYETIEAEDGPSALLTLKRPGRIDLLLTDVVLPKGMNGPDLFHEASKLRPRLKYLYTSGYTRDAAVHRGINDEHFHFLTKPFSQAELAKSIRLALDGDTDS